MIVIFTGLPGSGKSYKLGRAVVDILYRNIKFHQKQVAHFEKHPELFVPDGQLLPVAPKPRVVWTNLKLSSAVEEEFKGYFMYWTELRQLTGLRDCDIVIDEVGTYFDSRLWTDLSLDVRRWLTQGDKMGIELYGTAQDFAQVDKSFRRLVNDLKYVHKVIGSRRPSRTKPVSNRIWGLCAVQTLNPRAYEEDKKEVVDFLHIPSFFFISKEKVQIYDTLELMEKSAPPPLEHIERKCSICGKVHIKHI